MNTQFLKFYSNSQGILSIKGVLVAELNFLDKILVDPGFNDIIEISQFVNLAFSLREKYVKTFLYVGISEQIF